MKETTMQRWAEYTTTRRLRTLAGSLILATSATLAGCGSDSSSAPSGPTTFSTPVGTYDAATINAKTLPVAIFSGDNYTYEVTSGSLSLTGDGKFLLKETFRQTVAGAVSNFVDSTYGSWVLSGSTVNFTSAQDGSTDKADWSNLGSLTFVEAEGPANNTYVYKIKAK